MGHFFIHGNVFIYLLKINSWKCIEVHRIINLINVGMVFMEFLALGKLDARLFKILKNYTKHNNHLKNINKYFHKN